MCLGEAYLTMLEVDPLDHFKFLFWFFFFSLFYLILFLLVCLPPRWLFLANLLNHHVVRNLDVESHLALVLGTKVYARQFPLQWFNRLDLSIVSPIYHVCTTLEFQFVQGEVDFIESVSCRFFNLCKPWTFSPILYALWGPESKVQFHLKDNNSFNALFYF